MKTQVPAAKRAPGGGRPVPDRRGRAVAALGTVAALVAVVAVVVPFFAATYAVHTFQVPLGWDTPKYLWKTALAANMGVTSTPVRLPPPVNGSPDRPAYAVLALVAHRVLGLDGFRTAEALPFASAAACGLAAAGFAAAALRRARWECAVIGASVGTSVAVARMAGPETYQDNLMVAAVLLAVAALAVAATGRRGPVAPALLLGAAALVHWPFALLFAGILAVAAAVAGRDSWRRWRSGTPPLRTPAGGLLGVAVGGLAAGVVALFGGLGAELKRPKTSPQAHTEYVKKARQDAGQYVPWFTAPAAALGALVLWGRGERPSPSSSGRSLAARAVLAAWLGVTAVAAALGATGVTVPVHRFLAFALPVPLLVAVGALALPRRLWTRPGWRAVGVATGVAILGVALGISQAAWLRNRPQMNPVLVRQVANAEAYLDRAGVPADRPVVFVANVTGNAGVNLALFAHEIRAALAPERVTQAYMYLGDPETFLAGRPTIVARPDTAEVREYDGTSWRYFRDVRPLLPERPVALLLPEANPERTTFDRWVAGHDPVAPGVWVVRGPSVPVELAAAPSPVGPVAALPVAVAAVALVALLFAVGSGWSVAAARGRPVFAALALAPAVGIAALVVAGVAADRAGISLAGSGAAAVAVVAAVTGWVAAVLVRRGPGRESTGDGREAVQKGDPA